MITLKEWMEVADYRITEGGDYNGFGDNVYALTSWNGEQNGYSLEVIFDTRTQEVYAVEACDYKNQRAYRLINPVHKDEEVDKAAWDDVKWIDLESDDDWMQKALAIVAGEDYDTRVSIPLELPDHELFELMKQAHENDVTLNCHIESILRNVLDKYSE